MISKNNKDSQLMSPRNSVLVWVAGIMLGWGMAVVGVYQWIKTSNNTPVIASQAGPVIAKSSDLLGRDGKNFNQIEPASGKTTVSTETKQPHK